MNIQAELVRVELRQIDIKIVIDDRMHVLQWRRHIMHDEVLLDGKIQATSYGMWGREKVYGLVFGREPDGPAGDRFMLLVDPRNGDWSGMNDHISGVRLEAIDGPVLAYGSLDPKTLEKPSTFSDWMKKNMGIEWQK